MAELVEACMLKDGARNKGTEVHVAGITLKYILKK